MAPIRFLFSTGHIFGARFLRGLLTSSAYREGIIIPEMVLAVHPRHATDIVGYEDLQPTCAEFGIPVRYFDKITDREVLAIIRETIHSFHFVVGLSQLLPVELLSVPAMHCGESAPYGATYGVIGAHPTKLPIGRGRAPIPWTILRELTSSAVSVFYLEAEADSGPIIDSEAFPISLTDDASTVFDRVADIHELLGCRIAAAIATQSLSCRPQLEDIATFWERRTHKDSWIDFGDSAENIVRLVRAVAPPFPPAFFVYGSAIVMVFRAELDVSNLNRGQPGRILAVSATGTISIGTLTGVVRITEYDFWPKPIAVKPGAKVASTLSQAAHKAEDATF